MRPEAPAAGRDLPHATPDASLSVNETIRRWPASIAALNALGVDTCCGGAASLGDAAADVGVPADVLLDAVRGAIAATETAA